MKRLVYVPRYRTEFKIQALAALDANDGNIFLTAKELAIPHSTLWDWNKNRETISGEHLMQRRNRGLPLSERFQMLIQCMVEAMDDKVQYARLGETARTIKLMHEMSGMFEKEEQAGEAVYEKLRKLMANYDVEANYQKIVDKYYDKTLGKLVFPLAGVKRIMLR